MKNVILVAIAGLLIGCGGSTSSPIALQKGTVSGVVFDGSGNPVRGASVFIPGVGAPQTTTNSSGSYLLTGVTEGNNVLSAELIQNGVDYVGTTVVQVTGNEQTNSSNLVLIRSDAIATVNGTVTDQNGVVLEGAKVFAKYGNLFAVYDISDKYGHYNLPYLPSGVVISIVASGRGFDSDSTSVNLTQGQTQKIDFSITDPSNPTLKPPTNVAVVAWTSPASGRSVREVAAATRIKQLFDPKRASKKATRVTIQGNPVEIDLTWDQLTGNSIFGFKTYRAVGNGQLSATDVLRDPLAEFYADQSFELTPGDLYTYAVSSLNTSYPSVPNAESKLSLTASVTPLGDMGVASTTKGSNPGFSWSAAPGAETYAVYVFSEYPGLGINPLWTNSSSPTAGTNLVYPGPALNPGTTYYGIVLALAQNSSARSISPVFAFTP